MEITTKEIKAVNKTTGTTKENKPYARYEFEFTDGFKLSTFDANIGDNFQAGQKVDVSMKKSEKSGYYEMLNMCIASEKVSEASREPTREHSIVAQALTKAYCDAAPTDISKEDVWEAYQFFLKRQNGD